MSLQTPSLSGDDDDFSSTLFFAFAMFLLFASSLPGPGILCTTRYYIERHVLCSTLLSNIILPPLLFDTIFSFSSLVLRTFSLSYYSCFNTVGYLLFGLYALFEHSLVPLALRALDLTQLTKQGVFRLCGSSLSCTLCALLPRALGSIFHCNLRHTSSFTNTSIFEIFRFFFLFGRTILRVQVPLLGR